MIAYQITNKLGLILFVCLVSLSLEAKVVAINPCPYYSLCNSVDYHPTKNIFCVTFTQGNKVILYKNIGSGILKVQQILENPFAQLSEPQHAVFTPDGKGLIVANWTNQTFGIYRETNGLFGAQPAALIQAPRQLSKHKPHGISISPCGKFLAVAYGAAKDHERAVALYQLSESGKECKLVSALQADELPGIPKGVTFSPDGTCLLVTFSDRDSLVIFKRKQAALFSIPHQTLQGVETEISRPEDVKISPCGKYLAITNSDKHTVTFYHFDKISNKITDTTPAYVFKDDLCFPHGIAFSPDGAYFLITEFGPITPTNDGNIVWHNTLPHASKVTVFTLNQPISRPKRLYISK